MRADQRSDCLGAQQRHVAREHHDGAAVLGKKRSRSDYRAASAALFDLERVLDVRSERGLYSLRFVSDNDDLPRNPGGATSLDDVAGNRSPAQNMCGLGEV